MRDTIGAVELLRLQRRLSVGTTILWTAGTLSLFATVVLLGKYGHVEGSDMPPLLNALARWVFLFPGLQIVSTLADWAGIRPADGWVNLSMFIAATLTSLAFWSGVVPWVLTALRAYVWPWRNGGVNG